MPLQIRLREREPVLGKTGREFGGALQMFSRFAPAADTHRPAGGLMIKQTQTAIGAGVTESFVQLPRLVKFPLHLLHHPVSGQVSFQVRQFSHRDRQIVMPRG